MQPQDKAPIAGHYQQQAMSVDSLISLLQANHHHHHQSNYLAHISQSMQDSSHLNKWHATTSIATNVSSCSPLDIRQGSYGHANLLACSQQNQTPTASGLTASSSSQPHYHHSAQPPATWPLHQGMAYSQLEAAFDLILRSQERAYDQQARTYTTTSTAASLGAITPVLSHDYPCLKSKDHSSRESNGHQEQPAHDYMRKGNPRKEEEEVEGEEVEGGLDQEDNSSSQLNPSELDERNMESCKNNSSTFNNGSRVRTAYTSTQILNLEREFNTNMYLSRIRRIEMAQKLKLSEKQAGSKIHVQAY